MSYLDRRDLLSADLMTRSISKEGSIKYYNSDKNVANIYMKLMAESPDGAQKEVSVDEASNYTVTIDAIKSKTNQIRTVPGVLSNDLTDETCAIWKFELGEDLTNQIGEVICQTYVKNTTQNLTMRYFAYTVEADKLTGLNSEIVTDPDLPILKELIKEVQETAQTVNNIDNVNVSDTKTYSNKKIEEKFSGVDAQFNTIEQKKADKTEVDIERKRLDNIIANSNSTEGNSELVDIRIGADGTVYDCAGKAVREQFSNNNSKIQQNTSKNTEQDSRLINIEQKNKVQDVYLNGLFNENNDDRLTINGEGNDLKLEGSKCGLVTVDSVVGNSLVNLVDLSKCENYNSITDLCEKTLTIDYEWASVGVIGTSLVERLKPNSVYTVFMYITKNTVVGESKFFVNIANSARAFIESTAIETGSTGMIIRKLTTRADFTGVNMGLFPSINNGKTGQSIAFKYMILEGDYTNKPIPKEYLTGIQSSFEGSKVTKEMVDSGKELASNLGKYKVPMKVVGKNKFNKSIIKPQSSSVVDLTIEDGMFKVYGKSTADKEVYTAYAEEFKIWLEQGKTYTFSYKSDGIGGSVPGQDNVEMYWIKDKLVAGNPYVIQITNVGKYEIVKTVICSATGWYYGRFDVNKGDMTHKFWDIQIEEGTVVQPIYEPYFESTHNIYLNSPLLKGDVLDCRSDGVYHVHNMGRVVLKGSESTYIAVTNANTINFGITVNGVKKTQNGLLISDNFIFAHNLLDNEHIYANDNTIQICINKSKLETQDVAGIKKWLQNNPVTIVYELAAPYEEKVSDNKFLCEIANGSTLHLDSNIPVQSMKATYTSNVVSVVKLDKIQYQQ
ncbi:MAG TPA: hypothetical protein DDY58_09620, partial [Terrisporobacter glycolicus]